MELDYLNRCEQDLLQAVQDAESTVTELRRFAASFLLMQSRQSTPGTNTTTIASVESTEEADLPAGNAAPPGRKGQSTISG